MCLTDILQILRWNKVVTPCSGKTAYEHGGVAKVPLIKCEFQRKFMNDFPWVFKKKILKIQSGVPENVKENMYIAFKK